MEPVFIQPEILDIARTTSSVIVQERTVARIATNEEYTATADYVRRCKEASNTVTARFDEPVKKAHEAHKSLLKLRDEILAPIKERALLGSSLLVSYQQEQERIRLAQEAELRRLEEERRRQAEIERQAEIDRQTAIARRQAEEEQIAAAQQAQDLGHSDIAEQILSQPVEIEPDAVFVAPVAIPEPVVVAKTVPKVEGVSYRTAWDFEIQIPAMVPREYCDPVDAKIRATVKAFGDAKTIPGVRIFKRTISVMR